jgi:lipoxygenase homology domain-containing protein 1
MERDDWCLLIGEIAVSCSSRCWNLGKIVILYDEEILQVIFYKYGCDSEGLLPYEVFTMRLLTCPTRVLALEPEMTGPWTQGVLPHILNAF